MLVAFYEVSLGVSGDFPPPRIALRRVWLPFVGLSGDCT